MKIINKTNTKLSYAVTPSGCNYDKNDFITSGSVDPNATQLINLSEENFPVNLFFGLDYLNAPTGGGYAVKKSTSPNTTLTLEIVEG